MLTLRWLTYECDVQIYTPYYWFNEILMPAFNFTSYKNKTSVVDEALRSRLWRHNHNNASSVVKRSLRTNRKLTHHSIHIMKFIYPITGFSYFFLYFHRLNKNIPKKRDCIGYTANVLSFCALAWGCFIF